MINKFENLTCYIKYEDYVYCKKSYEEDPTKVERFFDDIKDDDRKDDDGVYYTEFLDGGGYSASLLIDEYLMLDEYTLLLDKIDYYILFVLLKIKPLFYD